MTCSSSSYLVTEVTRPCVGRDPVRFLGRPTRGDPMWQQEVPQPDHLLEIHSSNTKSCTVLVVEPAIHLWWSPLFGWQLQQAYNNGCMLPKINIILSKGFLHSALMIILKRFCISSIFDYHKEKSSPSLRLHCVCGGLMVVSFSKKHCGFILNSFVVCFKDKTAFICSYQSYD